MKRKKGVIKQHLGVRNNKQDFNTATQILKTWCGIKKEKTDI